MSIPESMAGAELLTAEEMRGIERAAIESGAVTGLELMERAGHGVVEAIFETWPALAAAPHKAVVLCGPGNNGGDGFVIARLLRNWGWEVELRLFGQADRLPPDARANHDRWSEMGDVYPIDPGYAGPSCGEGAPDIVVDAIFGTGMGRPLQGLETLAFNLCDFVELTPDGQRPGGRFLWPIPRVVAVDMPSGLCSDSGRRFPHDSGAAGGFAAHLTVSFHALKRGHVLADGPQACGRTVVKDIGLPSGAGADTVRLTAPPSAARLSKAAAGHKFRAGHALVLGGGPGRGGAARLSARAALRIGAGLVTIGCPPAALQENAARLDAVMLRPIADAAGLTEDLDDDRISALALGPGLGLGEREAGLVSAALGGGGVAARPTVLDADALTLIARDAPLFDALHARCVLTPHDGEFARLFPDLAERLNAPVTTGPVYSKIDATRAAAQRAGVVLLYKGPDTVIADPSGRVVVNAAVQDRAAPWLATAGAGDVLAGMIAGLLARGFEPMEAAATAAWLHVEAARHVGPGLIAEDIPDALPPVFRAMGV